MHTFFSFKAQGESLKKDGLTREDSLKESSFLYKKSALDEFDDILFFYTGYTIEWFRILYISR